MNKCNAVYRQTYFGCYSGGGRLVIKRPFCAAIIIFLKKNKKKQNKICPMNREYGCLLAMVEKGADEIIHRVYIITRKTKNQMFSRINTKNPPTYLRLETAVSSIFSRALRHMISSGGAYYSKRNGARELHQTIIQMYIIYKTACV